MICSLVMSLFVGIQDPIIQKFAIRIVGGIISSKTGVDLQIGRLYISPNFTIQIDHFLVKDLRNTDLLFVNELKVRPMMEEIVHGDIEIARVELTDAHANLITYEGEDHLNFQFLLDLLPKNDKPKKDKVVPIKVDRVIFKNLDFQFWNQNSDHPEKSANRLMDYSHLDLSHINLDMENLNIIKDSITGTIHHLAAKESSGFELRYLESKVNVSPHGILMDDLFLETSNSDLHLDLHMLFDGYKAMKRFTDSVTFDSKLYPSDLLLSDLGPFAKSLYEMPDKFHAEGLVKGTVRELRLRGFKAAFGKQTVLEGDLNLHPLDIKKGQQKLTIKKLNYDFEDITELKFPGVDLSTLPSSLAALGQGSIKGFFNGTMDKFKTEIEATSEIGNVKANLSKQKSDRNLSIFEGNVEAERLNVGVLVNAPKTIGELDLSADMIARLSKKGDIDLDIDGVISKASLLGNTLDEIALNGNLRNKCFNGKINVDDDDLLLDFKGRFDFTQPKSLCGDFQADIISANLKKLNLLKNQETALLSTSITADMTGINNFNDAEGTICIRDLTYTDAKGAHQMKQFDGKVTNDPLLKKRIDIGCDFLDFQMAGQMDFASLYTSFKQYVYSYVHFPQWRQDMEALEKKGKPAEQDFIVHLNLKEPKPLTSMFIPSVSIAKNTTLNITFTERTRSLNMTLRSKYMKVNKIKINDIECRGISSSRRSSIRLGIESIVLRDSTEKDPHIIGLEQFVLGTTLQNDSIKINLGWDDVSLEDQNKANLSCSFVPSVTGGRANIYKSNIVLNNVPWSFNPDNIIIFDEGQVSFHDLEFMSKGQSLLIDGEIPNEIEDTLSLAFNSFDLSTLNFLTRAAGLELNGSIFGYAEMSNMKNDKTVFADLSIDTLRINGEDYGEVNLISQWNNEESAVEADMNLVKDDHKTLNLEGKFYPQRKEDNLDFQIDLDGLQLSNLSPFLSSFMERLQGLCHGAVALKGSLSQPDIQGQVRIADGGAKINYLNTFYTFSPTIMISNDRIVLDDMKLTDTLGSSAIVSGYIKHDHLKNFQLELQLFPNNFLALNTVATKNSSFYGTAIASGRILITGPVNNIDLNIRATTKKGTNITLPLGGNSKVKTHDFITFVTPEVLVDDDEVQIEEKKKKDRSNINVGLDLNVNNNAQVKIILPNDLGTLDARGAGDLKIDLATATPGMSLIGDYVISEGGLTLTIEEIIRRNFSLQSGSKISWTGDAVNGIIDATGVYQTKAALSGLGLVDSTAVNASNVKVECLVHLKNKLLNPDISFSIRLPGASEDMKEAVFNVIDTTNQSDMLQQTLSLLVFGSFSYGSVSGYGILTNQLNDFISKITNIDININYKPGNNLSNEEMTLAMKKQLFDDRLTIETNFGVIIPTAYSSNSTNIVGDVNVDYKITKDGRFSVQVFNRSNFNTYYSQYTFYKTAPYTQGIGISYNRSFDRFRDLFKKRTNATLPNRPMIGQPRPTAEQPKPTIGQPKSTEKPKENENESGQ